MGFRSEQQLAKLLEHFKPEYRSYAAPLWASGITSADELADGSVDDLVTAGISNPKHAQDVKAKAGQFQTEYTQLITKLQAINAKLGPLQKIMQPNQVWYMASWLANALGAVQPSSRWLVCVAMWAHLFMLPVLAFILTNCLGKRKGLGVWLLVVNQVVVWWLGIPRDHQISDLPYLQAHIQSVRKFIEFQRTAAHRLRVKWGIREDHDDWKHLESAAGFKTLLDAMVQREEQLCSQFGEVRVGVEYVAG